jgi:uncharacterized protein YdbL (DUF1318 family)
MNIKAFSVVVISLLVVLFTTVASSLSEDTKSRMKERLPIIIELKAKEIVGEDNRGYLQFVGTKREQEDVVTAENNDRKSVYSDIAKKQGATVDFVGRRRAKQIVEKATKGEFLQDESGKWYKKQ